MKTLALIVQQLLVQVFSMLLSSGNSEVLLLSSDISQEISILSSQQDIPITQKPTVDFSIINSNISALALFTNQI